MINDILEEIRTVEKEAEEMLKKAAEDAKAAVLSADEECKIIRDKTVKAVKEERRKVVEAATKEANSQYAKIIAAGKLSAEKIKKDTELKEAIEFIKEKILLSYGNS